MEDFSTNTQTHEYSLKRLIAIVFFSIISLYSFSQGILSTQNKKAKKLYEKADKKYKERSFYEALNLLEEAAREDPSFFEAQIRMGSLYKAIGQEDSVYAKYQAYLNTSPDPIASVIEKLAFMAFDRGEYKKSSSFLNQFLIKVPERRGGDDIGLLLTSISFAREQIENYQDSISIEILPSNINKFKLQYLPSVTVDNSAMFYTKRDQVSGDEDIVVSYFRNGEWQPAQSVSSRINTPLNEGACSVSADGRIMIFTSCDKRDSYGSCDLYITKKVGDIWSRPKNLGKTVNSRYWESQPSLSADGKTLYFSSNRVGGMGGRDLWVSKNIDGKWTLPVNLGRKINSAKDETTPFIHPDGETLYFSANGYVGMGGYDLYKSTRNDSAWTEPYNLGYPINTYKDEVAIVIASDGSTSFYAKEEQKNYEILDSKIATTKLNEKVGSKKTTFLIGSVLDANTLKPLRAEVQVVDLSTNQNLYVSESDSITGVFYLVLPIDLELAAYVKKKGYLFKDYDFSTSEEFTSSSDTLHILLSKVKVGKTIVLKNIYFDVDSYDLKEQSLSEIDNAFQLLKDNPEIIVEIAGHTDDTGSYDYNLKLSENRAKAVFKELISKGINKERLNYKGYADAEPLKANNSELNKKSNRRIEFRVIRTKQ